MKRLITFALALILALSLAACGGNSGGNSNSGAAQSGGAQNNLPSENELEAGKEYAKDAVDRYGGDMSDEEKDKIKDAIDSVSVNWPADKLPDGMPVYPDGEMITGGADGMVSITVTGTSSETLSKYIDNLKSDGWDITELDYMDDAYMATKDSWQASIMFVEGGLIISVQQEN